MKEDSISSKAYLKQSNERLFIGLMSGTSVDSIDAVLISAMNGKISILDTLSYPIPPPIKKEIFALFQPGANEIEKAGELDVSLAREFARAALSICEKTNIAPDKIEAIGSHGQTVRHQPPEGSTIPFTLQIGDPNTLATVSGIPTVADFRRKDIALGGHGAPLAPGFHHYVFRDTHQVRVIVNIGGMANITVLDPKKETLGYDTGPGNALMDAWILKHHGKNYDNEGVWASQGEINRNLLKTLLDDPYFEQKAPKSTGRERFNNDWLEKKLADHSDTPATDIQATLCEVTAKSIANDIIKSLQGTKQERLVGVYICGGGSHNIHLVKRLKIALGASHSQDHSYPHEYEVKTTNDLGIPPDWVEAVAFAWLAMRRIDSEPGNLPSVTGASRAAILGGVYLP